MSDDCVCDCEKPAGFTYYMFVTVCDTCLTQFPYYDCYCELRHDNCNEERRAWNIKYRTDELNRRQQIL